ncbi:dihydrofolate reductase [Aestuariibius sp. HNIBRBA575]|uniref:dihydrofolate reductase n=1 Tax=Aestuariibius sp. HNIBRBA575 TaxID=3233343 RepID=UPI0034A56E9B
MITLIVARARNGAIGRDGDIPWFAPADLQMFKRETLGGAVIMGRNTWDSLPFKPLKNRFNCVVTRGDMPADHIARSVPDAIAACYEQGYHRVYGIGGATIYGEMLAVADRLLITEVDMDVPDADTFFPDFDDQQWGLARTARIQDEGPKCTLHEYLRKR